MTTPREALLACQHLNIDVSWDAKRCIHCGAFGTDSQWGIAKNMWFMDRAEAEFYRQHGRYPEIAPTPEPAAGAVERVAEAIAKERGELDRFREQRAEGGGWLYIYEARAAIAALASVSAPQSDDEAGRLRVELAECRRILMNLHAASVSAPPGWQPIDEQAQRIGRCFVGWRPFGGLKEHVELGYFKSGVGWCNTYGHSFHGDPDVYMPLPPIAAAVKP